MDTIFVRKGEYEKGDAAFPLIKEALALYDPEADATEIERTPLGRPYFRGLSGVDFSITHSGDIWMCLMSAGRCGIDFQYLRDTGSAKIGERYFTVGENEYMENGMAGPYIGRFCGPGERPERFFDIWTRREALGKYQGEGFFGKYPDSAPGGIPADEVRFGKETAYVHEITGAMLSASGIDTEYEFRAACVTGSLEPPVICRI